jgi:hypothetical protein
MRRFDDFLKILLSFLIGQLLRDSDKITSNLTTFFAKTDVSRRGSEFLQGYVAYWLPLFLVALYLKNIHASHQFDRCASQADYRAPIDGYTWGRFLTFSFSIMALFVFPYWAAHELAGHGDELVSRGKLFFSLFLFGPFLVYLGWDIVFFWGRQTEGTPQQDRVSGVVNRWRSLDFLEVLVASIAGVIAIIAHSRGHIIRAEYIGLGFIVVTTINILGDYIWNADFYFGPAPWASSARSEAVRPPARTSANGEISSGVAT